MLQQLNHEQKQCIEHAAEARQRASASSNSIDRDRFLDMEKRWLGLARSYEHVGQLQTFLNSQNSLPEPGAEAISLTDRETHVLTLMTMGLSYRQIAVRCGVSVSTVHSHLKNIYVKLGVHSKTQAIFQARHRRLIP
jgi:DNA-binding NarL/FixJ family response regulator